MVRLQKRIIEHWTRPFEEKNRPCFLIGRFGEIFCFCDCEEFDLKSIQKTFVLTIYSSILTEFILIFIIYKYLFKYKNSKLFSVFNFLGKSSSMLNLFDNILIVEVFFLFSIASRLYKGVIDELEHVKEESEAGIFIFI